MYSSIDPNVLQGLCLVSHFKNYLIKFNLLLPFSAWKRATKYGNQRPEIERNCEGGVTNIRIYTPLNARTII